MPVIKQSSPVRRTKTRELTRIKPVGITSEITFKMQIFTLILNFLAFEFVYKPCTAARLLSTTLQCRGKFSRLFNRRLLLFFLFVFRTINHLIVHTHFFMKQFRLATIKTCMSSQSTSLKYSNKEKKL
jgi:hypothetical protein